MTTQEAVQAVQSMKNAFNAFQYLDDVLSKVAGAEQVAREADSRRAKADSDLKAIEAQTRRAIEEHERNREEMSKQRQDAADTLSRYQAECAAKREALKREIVEMAGQRDALAAAVEQLRAAASRV